MEQGQKLILQNTYLYDIFKSQLLVFVVCLFFLIFIFFLFFFSFGLMSLDQFDVTPSSPYTIIFCVQKLIPTEGICSPTVLNVSRF